MSKVVISPLLSSLFKKSDGMTKDEANVLVDTLSQVDVEDTKMVLAQSTSRNMGKANYVTIHRSDANYEDIEDINNVLTSNGWMVTESRKGCSGSWWIYFIRN